VGPDPAQAASAKPAAIAAIALYRIGDKIFTPSHGKYQ
jgi:hypothetical protein